MIWDPNRMGRSNPVLDHLAHKLSEIGGGESLIGTSKLSEVARAVEAFLDESGQADDVKSNVLIMLAGQALISVGEGVVARKLVLLGTGLVRPSEWVASGSEDVWVLDLRQMTVREDAELDLVFFRCLGLALGSIAELWDVTAGRGVLGLRHVTETVRNLLGTQVGRGRLLDLAWEIKAVCAQRLEQIAGERKWDHVPRVLDMDL